MTQRGKFLIPVALSALVFGAACSPLEDANNGKGYAGKADTPAYAGSGGQYTAGGWEAGNKEAWADNLRVRAKGQNEYTRTGDAAPAAK
ncbi:hypothetical protein [Limnobacter sp.]|uniref:hypothetical protein n=1 Tax=Limnobacter sp. TaxID=2003368 RepID=UPI003519CAD1